MTRLPDPVPVRHSGAVANETTEHARTRLNSIPVQCLKASSAIRSTTDTLVAAEVASCHVRNCSTFAPIHFLVLRFLSHNKNITTGRACLKTRSQSTSELPPSRST